MEIAKAYLIKHQFIKPDISRVPQKKGLLKYIVIIPAFCEPDIFDTLHSIKNCTFPSFNIEVFILVNYPLGSSEEIKAENNTLFSQLKKWSGEYNHPHLSFTPLLAPDLPDKHAGAGLARKILMDSACQRFDEEKVNDGVIFSLDADTLVPPDYFTDLERLAVSPKTGCFIFNFKHPLEGNAFPPDIYNAIILYELHLRYYKNILQSIGYPYYQYTIGSCFAVRAKLYMQAGGMSRRKGGEDFYFLHKIFPNTETEFLNHTYLTPSPRASWRVPFGTGPAIKKIIDSEKRQLKTYHPKSFLELKPFIEEIPLLWDLNAAAIKNHIKRYAPGILNFLISNDSIAAITEIKNNCATQKAFTKRLLLWFDAFKVLKYLNYTRDNYYADIDIIEAVNMFLKTNLGEPKRLLEKLRERDDVL